ncbi:MAG TPA: hypothetical protein VKE88_03375 [Candidatus Nanoarchaeia archaeon]|nr:hypothetical protein [Candidatus Nanoarchaeia archaeon]
MIANIHEATKRICQILNKVPKKVEEVNEGRYKIVYFQDETILIKYTREHFLSFRQNAHGESINKDDLENAIAKGIKRVFVVYADDKQYTISPYTIKAQAEVRKTEWEGKETYSFAMDLLIPLKEFIEAN